MARRRSRLARRQVLRIDALILLWVLGWIAVGIWVAVDVYDLGRLSTTLGTAAAGLQDAAKAIKRLSGLPFVGSTFRQLADHTARTAASASANAGTTFTSVHQLAYLLGIVICLVPSVPVLAAWLPARVAHAREVSAVRRALTRSGDLAHLKRYLANRALANLPFHQLVTLGDDPWEDAQRGHLDALAGAELERLGLRAEALRSLSPPERRYVS